MGHGAKGLVQAPAQGTADSPGQVARPRSEATSQGQTGPTSFWEAWPRLRNKKAPISSLLPPSPSSTPHPAG